MMKVDAETAEQEFDRFLEAMDIFVEESTMSDDDKSGFSDAKERVLRAIRNGHLVINDNGEAVYTPHRVEDHEPLVFHERTGATMMQTDRKKGEVAKGYIAMGEMCRVESKVFAKLKGADIKTCEAIFVLLMA